MTLDTLIILGGAFVAVLPFLGFPSSWDSALLFIAGIFIISLGIALRRRKTNRSQVQKNGGVFLENGPMQRDEHDAH